MQGVFRQLAVNSERLPFQWSDKVKDVTVGIANSELSCLVKCVVDVFLEIDAIAFARHRRFNLTGLEQLVQIINLVRVKP